MNITLPTNKNEVHFQPKKNCAICKCNGGTKKHVYGFSINRKAKVCIYCSYTFQSPVEIIQWLERHAIYSPTGKLIDFDSKPLRRSWSEKKRLTKERQKKYRTAGDSNA